MEVRRNAFGRQLESFEADLQMRGLRSDGGALTMHAVFIRAPEILSVGAKAETVATLDDGRVVAARQGNVLGISFHPEIAGEVRVHRWLVNQARRTRIAPAR